MFKVIRNPSWEEELRTAGTTLVPQIVTGKTNHRVTLLRVVVSANVVNLADLRRSSFNSFPSGFSVT